MLEGSARCIQMYSKMLKNTLLEVLGDAFTLETRSCHLRCFNIDCLAGDSLYSFIITEFIKQVFGGGGGECLGDRHW